MYIFFSRFSLLILGMSAKSDSNSALEEVTDSQKKMRGPITEYLLAKDYLNKHKIPQMFDSLLAALMLEKPDDHFEFLDVTLEKVKAIGAENINWETFVYDLHPLRDPNRLEYIHDEVYENHKKSVQKFKELVGDEDEDQYESKLFKLTETTDNDDD